MKKLLAVLLLFALTSSTAQAGVITHTDYIGGNVITSAAQNTNENTIVNEMNGNLDTANFEDGGIATADLADNAVTNAKLATNVQSTFTYVQQLGAYRRPVLQYVAANTVDVENNTGTQHQTCIFFPNERRCVTENTGSTTQYRRFDASAACNFVTGTEESGLSGATEAGNTWYALYGVKSQISASNFVVCGSTRTPTQANVSSLNTMYGTEGWTYLGMVRNGADGTGSTTAILNFTMAGNRIDLLEPNNGGSVGLATPGIRFADSAGAASLTYTFAAGTGNLEVPSHLSLIRWSAELNAVASTHVVDNGAGTNLYITQTSNSNTQLFMTWIPTGVNVRLRAGNGTSIALNLILSGWIDGALGVGFNPQI